MLGPKNAGGQVGDGEQSSAYILYSDNDIQHVGFWARDMARQQCFNDSAKPLSDALPFSYSHLSGKCRHKVLVSMFSETQGISCPANCCDVRQMELATLHERSEELSVLIQAIVELGKMGEVKVTEWVRGGEIAWMEK